MSVGGVPASGYPGGKAQPISTMNREELEKKRNAFRQERVNTTAPKKGDGEFFLEYLSYRDGTNSSSVVKAAEAMAEKKADQMEESADQEEGKENQENQEPAVTPMQAYESMKPQHRIP